jgi:predicted HTH transcriptional regulator
MSEVYDIVNRCISHGDEAEWFEFKENLNKPDDIGEYISALSNAAVMANEPFGYLIWGVHNTTHEFTGTKFNYNKDINNEPFQHYLSRKLSPAIYFRFCEEEINGKRVVVLIIPAARIVPTEYKEVRYIRIGSSKENIKKHPDREAALFSYLNYGPPTLLNIESRYTDLTFEQLFLYYDMKGIRLREETFKKNLELLTPTGKYNMLAQLLSDTPHIPIRFALFNGDDKSSTMYAVRDFGNMCLLLALEKVIDYGDTINVPQADERDRRVERKEVRLFNQNAFMEAVINAFQHNLWTSGSAPKFHAYKDRIEITSLGTLPSNQTKDGFFAGISVPVNDKLSEIFLQLHISEMSGRGVPRIVDIYGKEAFEFRDNAIVVTIPFNRLDLDNDVQDDAYVQDDVQDDAYVQDDVQDNLDYITPDQIESKILELCTTARSALEITDNLRIKGRKTVSRYIRKLLNEGKIAMTLPEKPKSKNQKYIAIK